MKYFFIFSSNILNIETSDIILNIQFILGTLKFVTFLIVKTNRKHDILIRYIFFILKFLDLQNIFFIFLI